MGSAHAVIGWLEPRVGGADNGRPAKLVLPSLQASIAASPNRQPRLAGEVLGWLREAFEPTAAVEQPPISAPAGRAPARRSASSTRTGGLPR